MSNIEQQWANVDLANSLTTSPSNTTQNEESGLVTDKLLKLEEARRSKLSTLEANSTTKTNNNQTNISDLDEVGLTAYLQNKNAEGVNYDSASTIQEVLGNIPKYIVDPETYKGDTKGVYIGETANGQMKLGLRAGNKTYEDRYTPDWKQYIPFARGYGWDSGPEGVKPAEKDAHMDITVPAALANAFEKYTHLNAGQLAERTIGQGPVTPEWDRKLGAGKTEYTSRNAPMWNQDYDVSSAVVQEDTPLPGSKRSYEISADGTVDKDGRLLESIDLAQSAGVKYWGDMADTARSASRSLAGTLGVSEENIDKYLPKNPRLLGTDLTVDEARNNQEKVDKSVGYSTRKAWQEEKKAFQDAVGESSYGTAAWNVVSNLDRYLAESAPEMVALMAPYVGMPAVLATRLNNQMEVFEENNGRKMTTEEAFTTAATILPSLVAEKVLVKSGVSSALDTGKTIAGRVAGTALSAGGEALQEGYEATQEQWAVGDVNKRGSLDALKDYATSDETVGGIIAGGVMGGALSGTGQAIGAVKDKVFDSEIADKVNSSKNTKQNSTNDTKVDNYVVSEADKESAATDLIDIDSRLQDTSSVITSNDISRLAEIEELMNNISTTPEENKKVINDIITSAREKYKSQVVNGSLDGVVLKSREDIMELMSDLYTMEDTDTTEVDNKLYTLASKAGLVKDRADFDVIKKDYYAVEAEAVDGKRGYVTLGKELKQLMEATTPNSKKIQAKVDKLRTFKTSQEAYIRKAEEMIAEANRIAADYNSSIGSKIQLPEPKQFAGKVAKTGTVIKMNFSKNVDGTFRVNMKGLDTILDAKGKTIKGISSILKTSSKKLSDLGVSDNISIENGIVVDTTGIAKKLKRALVALESKIKKNNINKIITVGETYRNDYTKAVVSLNSSSVNMDSYEESDNVLITIPPEMKEADIKKELAKGGSLYKLLESVRQAGATVHLDAGKNTPDNKVIRAVRRALTKYGEVDSRYSPLEYGSLTLMPTKAAEEFRKNKKENTDKTKADKEAKNIAEDEALTRYLNGDSIEEIWNSTEILKSSYRDTDSSSGVDKLEKKLLSKSTSAVDTLYKAKVNLDIAVRSKEDSATIAILKDELENIEKEAHPKIIEEANFKVSQRSTLKGIINEIKEIKEEKLTPEDEESRIQDLLADLNSTSTIDVLTQPESGETFKTNGVNIPIKINKFVKVKDTSSILQIVPVDILFDDTLGINKSSIEYVEDIIKFIKETQVLSDKDVVSEKTNTNKRDAELHDSPALALVFDADGNVNQQVAIAMKLALGEYISFNMNMLDSEYKAKEDVAQMIGVLEGQVGPATYRLLKDKGVFNKTAAVKVGTAFMDKMGLGFKKADGIEKELYNKLVADIGNMTLLYAKNEGILEGDEVLVKSFGDARQSDTGTYIDYSGQGEGTVIHTVRMPKRKEDGSLDNKVKEATEEYKVIHEAIAEKSSFERAPSRKPIKVEKSRHIVEKVAKDIIGLDIPNAKKEGLKSPKEFIESLVKIKWKVDTSALNRLFMLDDTVIKSYLEYATEEELSNMTFDGRASAVSKNREIEKSIEELKKLKADIESNSGMAYDLYFDWFYSSNGRYMMESNTLNPQTDKLHRFIVQPASHRTTYSIKDGKIFTDNKDVTLEMDYALAQAFGYAVDKESTSSIQNIAQELKDLGYSEIKKLVESGSKIVLPSKTLEIEHLTHALQALDVLESLENGDTKFSSAITAEYDAVTSGFGLKLMQFPILKDVWTWLNKVGVFQKGKTKHNSMNDILSEVDFYDSYQELAKNVKVEKDSLVAADAKARGLWEAMFELLPKSAGATVSKELRTLFKDPFMTFNYSAGIKSIKASLANKLSTGILEGIVKNDPKYSEIAKQLAVYTDMEVSELVEALKTRPAESIKITGKATFISVGASKKNKRFNIKDALDAIMEETYGAQVEEIMTTKFGRFIEINNMVNSSFRAMFDAFKVKYDEEKTKYAVGEFTEDAFSAVMDKLQNEFPLIKGPLSSGISDGVGIYDLGSQNVSDDNARYRPAQTKTGSKESGKRTLKVRHAIKDFEAAISAGSVVPIHYIDGALMAQMQGVTAIHDAIMPKLSKSLESIKAYNKAMFDVNKQYNFLEEVLNMLNRVDVTGNKTETQIKVKNADGEWEYETMSVAKAFDVLRESVGETVAEINTKKAEVYSKIARIGHMAGIPGSMWTTSEENEAVSKQKGSIISKLDKVQQELGTVLLLTKEMEEYLDTLTEEQISDIIEGKKACLK